MTPLDVLINVDEHDSVDSIAEQAIWAEDLGYERVSMGETTGWNNVALLSVVAERTETIGIGNDVFSPFSRTPGLLAQTGAALQEISGGRYRMGVGTSSPPLVEQWHGLEFDRPLRRLREAIDIMNEAYAGDRVDYDGDIFDLGGLRLEGVPDSAPPVDVSVLGPKAVELTGRFADGWIPQLFTPDGLQERLEDLRRGAELGERDPDDIRVSPIIRCCALEDGERARSIARRMVAFLIGAYGPYYRKSIVRQGYEDVVDDIRAGWEERDTDAMAAALPDSLLDEVAAAGTPDEVRERVERYGGQDGVDAVRVGFFTDMTREDEHATLEELSEIV